MLEQLNLFDLEDVIDEKRDADIKDMNEKLSTSNDAEKFVVLLEILETTETTEQVAALKCETSPSTQKQTLLQVMDKVKIVLISEELDSETHNYRKYYEPHLIGKVGEITNILVSSKGKKKYEVDIYGEKSIFEEAELIWIG